MICPLRNAESRVCRSAFLPAGQTTNLSACLAVGDCGVSKYRSTEGVQLGAPAPALGSFLLRSSFSGQKGLIYFPRSVRPLNVVFTGFLPTSSMVPGCFVGGPSHG